MKAAVYYGQKDVRVQDVVGPIGELGSTQVLLRSLYAGICGTDLHEFVHGPDLIPTSPHPLTEAQLPQILGHEFSAEVLATGSGVIGVSAGDLVAVRPGIWCGRCPACRSGLETSCSSFAAIGLSHAWGGLAERVVADESQLTVMPAGVSPDQAALMEPAAVAVNAYDAARNRPGGRVLITGGGPIGALVAMYAFAAGAGEVVISEPNAERRKLLSTLGVATVLDPAEISGVSATLSHEGFDACIEAAGKQSALDLCVTSVRAGGVIVQTGLHVARPTLDIIALNVKQVSLVGTWCWPTSGWEKVARLIADGRLPVEKLVTATIALDDLVSAGIEALLDPQGNHLKILICNT
jgi:(R,R)-butanediol dehydrogenase/meso-butanediol dehydrogenase/diacetyl reductase